MVYCVYTRIVSTKDAPRRANVYKRRTKTCQDKSEKLVINHKILVHAQDSCACTTLLCMHNTLVDPQRFLLGPGLGPWPLRCMHKNKSAVHAQGVLCMHSNLVHAQESWTYLCNLSIIRSMQTLVGSWKLVVDIGSW